MSCFSAGCSTPPLWRTGCRASSRAVVKISRPSCKMMRCVRAQWSLSGYQDPLPSPASSVPGEQWRKQKCQPPAAAIIFFSVMFSRLFSYGVNPSTTTCGSPREQYSTRPSTPYTRARLAGVTTSPHATGNQLAALISGRIRRGAAQY